MLFLSSLPWKWNLGHRRDVWNGLTNWIKQKWTLREATFQSGSHAWWACVPGNIFRKTWQMAGKEGTDSPNWMTWCEKEVFAFYPHFLFRNWPVSAIAWLGLTTRHVGCWWDPLAPTCRTFIFLSFYFWVRTCWTIKDKPIPKVKLTRHLSHLCILHNRPIFIWIKFKDT